MTRGQYEAFIVNAELHQRQTTLDMWDKDFRDGVVTGTLYGLSGTRPSDAAIKEFQGLLGNARVAYDAYCRARDSGDPTATEAARQSYAKAMAKCTRLESRLLKESDEGTKHAEGIIEMTEEIAKATLVTGTSTIVTLATLGAAAPAGVGVAGASWTAVGASILAGTGAGVGAVFTAIEQGQEHGWNPAHWSGAEMREKMGHYGTMAFVSSLSAVPASWAWRKRRWQPKAFWRPSAAAPWVAR